MSYIGVEHPDQTHLDSLPHDGHAAGDEAHIGQARLKHHGRHFRLKMTHGMHSQHTRDRG